jgi:hypothetical protein
MDRKANSGSDRDERRVYRIVVDVLATGAQLVPLQDVIGAALCDGPLLHEGACRVAWSLSYTAESDEEDDADVSYGLDRAAVDGIYEHLLPIETWPSAAVDRSLGIR